MIRFKGAYENGLGNVFCSNCGAAMKTWEKMATMSEGGCSVYVFRCKKCKKRIEAYNDKAGAL